MVCSRWRWWWRTEGGCKEDGSNYGSVLRSDRNTFFVVVDFLPCFMLTWAIMFLKGFSGFSYVYNLERRKKRCYHFVTTLLSFCYHFVTICGDMLPLCYHFVTILLSFCYHLWWHVTILLSFCYHLWWHVTTLLSLCYHFVIILLPFVVSFCYHFLPILIRCYHFVTILLSFCYHLWWHVTILLPFFTNIDKMLPLCYHLFPFLVPCYHFVIILLPFVVTCYHFVTILLPFRVQTILKRLADAEGSEHLSFTLEQLAREELLSEEHHLELDKVLLEDELDPSRIVDLIKGTQVWWKVYRFG